MSDRDSYFKRRIESIEVHGVERFLVPMSGGETESLIKNHSDQDTESVNVLATVLCACACDKDGTLLFRPDEVAEVMKNVDFDVLKIVAEKALEISGMGEDSGNG